MKNLTKGLLTVSLAAAFVGAVGCNANGSDAWKGTTFTDYGNVKAEANGGFVAETDKYVYFINGVGSSSSDNTFGTPIKGALVAADRNDLTNTQVVIPELIVSTDYEAGVYLFKEGDAVYAYYGTPNREKNSSGAVASSEMTFTKTRLDGKENTKLFPVSSHSTTYRMAQGEDGAVYIVYYDTDNSALVSYNAKTGKSTTIAKTDAKTNDKVNGEYLSLGEYKFLQNGGAAQVVYTMTVYSQEYSAEQEEQTTSYSRDTATYNYMYLYKAGEEPVCIKDGKDTETTYVIKSTVADYLFYTETKLVGGGDAKTYGVKLSALDAVKTIDYADNIKDGMVIKDWDKVYYFDSDAKKVVKTTLVKEPTPEEDALEYILKDDTISKLLDVDENYVYGYNSDGYIVAIEREANGKTIRVSERTASTSWYAPETVEIDGEHYILYCDNSTDGNSYVYSANLKGLENPAEQDTDDDGTADIYYLESSFIGVMPAADRAAVVSAKINAIENPLDLKEGDDGKYYVESYNAAKDAYDNLDKDAQSKISAETLKKLTNVEKAIALADAYKKLAADYTNISEEEKNALKAPYEAAKKLAESYGDDYSTIAAYLPDNLNLNYYYQQATKTFA